MPVIMCGLMDLHVVKCIRVDNSCISNGTQWARTFTRIVHNIQHCDKISISHLLKSWYFLGVRVGTRWFSIVTSHNFAVLQFIFYLNGKWQISRIKTVHLTLMKSLAGEFWGFFWLRFLLFFFFWKITFAIT